MLSALNFAGLLREIRYVYGLSRCKIHQKLNIRLSSTLSFTSYSERNDTTSKNPIIILHGLFGSKTNWNSLSKLLTKNGRRVIAVDARNHGGSFHKASMTYEEMSNDLVQLMSSLEIPQAVIIGHSMGGKTAMITALQHPEIISSLIVVDVAPCMSPLVDVAPHYAKAMKSTTIDPAMNIVQARRSVNDQLLPVLKDTTLRQFILTNLVEKEGKVQWRLNLDAIITDFEEIMAFPERGNSYEGPTLFIGGQKSCYIGKAEEPEIQRLFPNSKIQFIPDAKHWPHFEKPKEFLAVVNSFLETLQV